MQKGKTEKEKEKRKTDFSLILHIMQTTVMHYKVVKTVTKILRLQRNVLELAIPRNLFLMCTACELFKKIRALMPVGWWDFGKFFQTLTLFMITCLCYVTMHPSTLKQSLEGTNT